MENGNINISDNIRGRGNDHHHHNRNDDDEGDNNQSGPYSTLIGLQ